MLLLAKMQGMMAGGGSLPPKTLATPALPSPNTSTLSTYTFSSVSIGAADSSRMVIVGISAPGPYTRTLSSVTIGGITADIIVNANNIVGADKMFAVVAAAMVPTGTTANVVVVFSNTMYRAAVVVWSAVGFIATTAYDTGSSSASPGSDTLSTLDGGFALGINFGYDGGGVRTTTWTNLTERVDAAMDNSSYSAADATTSAGSLTITSTWSNTVGYRSTAMASW